MLLGNEKMTKYKRLTIRCVILFWFLLVFVGYYVTFFGKVLRISTARFGILGALVDFFGR